MFELSVEIAIGVVVGLYTGDRVSNKINRLAQASERMASSLEAIAAADTFKHYQKIVSGEKRRHVTPNEETFIMNTPGCAWDAYVGFDNQIHPDYCHE